MSLSWRNLFRRLTRRRVLVAVSMLPLFFCALLLVRGFFALDFLTLTHARFPYWQIELLNTPARVGVSLRFPGQGNGWPGTPAAHWYTQPPGSPLYRTNHPVFSFLGLREYHYKYVDADNEYHDLTVPAWLLWATAAVPLVIAARLSTGGSLLRFLTRLCLAHAAAWSLGACLLVILLWARSYRAWDCLHYSGRTGQLDITLVAGELSFRREPITNTQPYFIWLHDKGVHVDSRISRAVRSWTEPGARRVQFLGFTYARGDEWARLSYRPPGDGTRTAVGLPLWFLAAAFAAVPLLHLPLTLRRRTLRRRLAANCCPACGYDLRAHAPGQNCPECGTLICAGPPGPPPSPPG